MLWADLSAISGVFPVLHRKCLTRLHHGLPQLLEWAVVKAGQNWPQRNWGLVYEPTTLRCIIK